jgi:putative thioredoxin
MSTSEENESAWIVETSSDKFQLDVIDRSEFTTVVVDFWAEWCQPCRMLAPLLEELAREYDGRFFLVKANVDQMQDVAAQFQVQSIPAVFALRGGKVVDFFQGVLPPEELRRWIDRLVTLSRLEEAEALEDVSPEKAEVLYRELAELLPSDKDARPTIGLGRALLAQQKLDEAAAIVDALEKRGFLESEAEKLKAAVQLQNKGHGDVAGLREAVRQDPHDLQRQLDLAEVLAGQKEYEEALEICLGVVEKNKQQFGDPARKIMVDIFHVLPNDSELTRSYRRRLSTLLY